jgi:hypothetical protein
MPSLSSVSSSVVFLAASVAVFSSGACSSSGGSQPRDAAVFDLSIELPDGCPPAQGNEKGVGIPCTRGGGECTAAGVPGGLHCTCDPYLGIQLTGVPCVCTLVGLNADPQNVSDPCTQVVNGYCGTQATCCPYMTAGYFCSPDVCLPGGQCLVFTAGPGAGGTGG